MKRFAIPLVVLIVLLIFLAVGLNLNPRLLPSPLINQAAPAFSAPRLFAAQEFNPEQMRGRLWLLNVWASWCAACLVEHPRLQEIADAEIISIVGLNYKDQDDAAREWLNKFGSPYQYVAVDADGEIGIEYGVYGVPETYLIDGAGIIRFKHVGPLDSDTMQDKLLPLIAELKSNGGRLNARP